MFNALYSSLLNLKINKNIFPSVLTFNIKPMLTVITEYEAVFTLAT